MVPSVFDGLSKRKLVAPETPWFSRVGLVVAAELLWRDGLQDFEQRLAGRVILGRVAIVARASRDLRRCWLIILCLHGCTGPELSAVERIILDAFGCRSPSLSRRIGCRRLRGGGMVDRGLGVFQRRQRGEESNVHPPCLGKD